MRTTFVSTLLIAPGFSYVMKNTRIRFNIKTSYKDLADAGVAVTTRKMKNRNPSTPTLESLWNNPRKMQQQRGSILIKPQQERILRDNQRKIVPLSIAMEMLKKITDDNPSDKVDKIMEELHHSEKAYENSKTNKEYKSKDK